ncbi:LIC11073 family putative lipoprotein [Leptospira ilyithenensis]|uniref:Lipoprotein n=1 Tax=Leptospira ilyithenensis TaxID=2484901 RepID=A0A4R9LTA1_9LEPT|nr:hypothetical protein [Leptospira ilyithenensis]TGN11908.1 hypothetical protein EHS11_05200 [Leptospira ilyithenensis]
MRRTLSYPIYLVSFSFLSFFSCGTNTDTPVAPFIFLVPPSVPQILAIVAVNSNITDNFELDALNFNANPRPEFLVRYYITNREPQFQGYNLYITTATPAIIQTISGEWLEDGVQPSFPHLPFQNSTDSKNIITKRIRYQIPPPGVYPFQKCQIYNFTLRSFLANGLISNPSASVSNCSGGYEMAAQALGVPPLSLCPANTGCNTNAACAVSGCGTPSACPLGSACNPCLVSGKETLGCPCPSGSKPPGCQFIGP